jgi:hypothetical protein
MSHLVRQEENNHAVIFLLDYVEMVNHFYDRHSCNITVSRGSPICKRRNCGLRRRVEVEHRKYIRRRAVRASPEMGLSVTSIFECAFPKQAMEMTEYGKPRSRLSTLPTLGGNPFGLPTFPRLDCWYISKTLRRHRSRVKFKASTAARDL